MNDREGREPPRKIPIPDEIKQDPYSWYNREKTFRSMAIYAIAIAVATFATCVGCQIAEDNPKPNHASAEPFPDNN